MAAEDRRVCSQRSAYQDQQAAGLMTLEELGSKLQEVDDARKLAHTELEALTRRQEHIEQLENNVESLLKLMAERVPDALEGLIPNPVVEYTYAKEVRYTA